MPNWAHVSAEFSDTTYVQEISNRLEETCPKITDLYVSDDDLRIGFQFPWSAPIDEIREIIIAYPSVEMEFSWHEINMAVFGNIYAPGDGTALILEDWLPQESPEMDEFLDDPQNYARTNTDGRAQQLV